MGYALDLPFVKKLLIYKYIPCIKVNIVEQQFAIIIDLSQVSVFPECKLQKSLTS